MTSPDREPAGLLPGLRSLRGYRGAWLLTDSIAGVTVWALVVPESMAYATIAGVPVQFGLYSVPLAVLGYLLFGTSKRLFVGPSSTIASLSAATVAPVAAASADNYVALTAALSIVVGVAFITLGLARMGFIARFFAKPVLDGFIVGLGLFIAVGQLYKIVGAPKPSGNTVRQLWEVCTSVADWNWPTVAVGATGLAILFAAPKVLPKVPGALVVVVLGLSATAAFDLTAHGVHVVGTVPTGFAFVSMSGVTWDDVWRMIPGALGIVVVGFAQSLAIAKAYAVRDNETLDANREMIGYGAASVGAGLLQGFAPTGSLSKSAAASEAGAKTPLSFAVVAALVVATVLFLAGLFEDLPEAVLGAIVVHAVAGMVDFGKLRRLRRARVPDFWLALGALLGVILVGIIAGIVVGVVLSLAMLVHRLDHPHGAVLGVTADGTRYAEVDVHEGVRPVPGVLVYRLEAPLIFANADVVADELRELVAHATPEVGAVVLDLEAVYEIDTAGAEVLGRLHDDLERSGVRLVLARAHFAVLDYLRRDGTLARFDGVGTFARVADAVDHVRPG